MDKLSNETPLMQQYYRIKAEHRDEILLFRMGDFYEMFCEDAKLGAKVLGVTLTSRNNGAAGRIPLAGVPVRAVEGYIARLIKAGYKVAVCDQVEDPKLAKVVVKRAVTEVLSPGTVMSDNLLEAGRNSFIAAAHPAGKGEVGLAWLDLSTGEFFLSRLPLATLGDELRRIAPRELLLEGYEGLAGPPLEGEPHPLLAALGERPAGQYHLTFLEDWRFDPHGNLGRLKTHFQVATFNGFGIEDDEPALIAAGVILDYVGRMQPAGLAHILRLQRWHPDRVMVLDRSTVANLELVESFRGEKEGTLLAVLDRTRTAMGARLLRRWVLEPLMDLGEIAARHDLVEALCSGLALRRELRELLAEVSDLERLAARVSSGKAGPRELVALAASLEQLPALKELLRQSGSPALAEKVAALEEFPAEVALVRAALVDDPPALTGEGGMIRAGWNPALDELRALVRSGKDWIVRLEADERKRTGIGSLKVRYNRVFGYFIEVSKSQLGSVPADYIRKQTISTGERYVTPALKDYEEKVLGGEEKIFALEAELFGAVRERLAARTGSFQQAARALGELDVLATLADVAHEYNYVRPRMEPGDRLLIREGRHPVVERMLLEEAFVPNDIELDCSRDQIIILTGPNMAGKSTILRQVGLIVLLAQMGGFVPAAEAVLAPVDRIFTRVGASDNLARGQSTFMVEMNETANILNNATARSLVLLDEIGRGTSTFDGLSIAWAVTEFLHETPARAAKTIFATHYHELTELEALLPRVRNYNVLVKEYGERVIFLHKIQPGRADRSYGIQVARLAGIPRPVVARAREVLDNLESGEFTAEHIPRLSRGRHGPRLPVERDQLTLFGGPAKPHPVVEELKELDLDSLSPREALRLLYELKGKI